MSSNKPRPSRVMRRLLRHFWQGVFVLAPIGLTLATLAWLFEKVDGILRDYVRYPGVGFVLVLGTVVLVGWFASYFFMRRMFKVVDGWIEHTPGVSFIYSTLRDFFEAFVGNKRRFTHAVLVNVHSEEVWMLGFLTSEDLDNFKLGAGFVSVYVPQAYHVAGQLYLVKRERVRPIEHLASGDVMKYAMTGGVVDSVDTGST
ncbi:DUF502 domain-containing protein [Opitutus sp. GAS368]|uniref:DUF502 domain-containing protein n=1 Tax=Opitutus sp. GAS368 TaxID=1882749 RepID=UPI00087DE5CC|nr:DUF502 domain-containing protein [Opitutus sp. GAS368]SDS13262.1 Uncharacterized membrane protein [Opitutus sp. GAS368]